MKDIKNVKANLTSVSDLTSSANTFAEIDGYTRCLKIAYSNYTKKLETLETRYQSIIDENKEDEHIKDVYTKKLNDVNIEKLIILAQLETINLIIPKYVFPTSYDSEVKKIISETDENKIASDIMSAFSITTKNDAMLFYNALFLGVKGTSTRERAGIWKDSEKNQKQDTEHVHYIKCLNKKTIEKNIILFICEKMAQRKVYVFPYPKWLESDFASLVNQIETIYKVDGKKIDTREVAIKRLKKMEKLPKNYKETI